MQRIKSTLSAPLLVVVVYTLLLLSRYIPLDSLMFKDNIYLSMIILQVMIFILPGIFYCKIRGKSVTDNLRLKMISPSKIWFVFSCFGVLVFGSTLINTATFYWFKGAGQYSLYDTYVPGGSGWTDIVYVVIAFAVLPAITEEFIFRGVLLSEYSDYGVGIAIVASAMMFSMLHFNLSQFFIYFYCGIVVAYAVYVTGSLLSAVLLHLLNNVYAIFFESVLWDVIKAPNSIIFFLFVVATLFMVFLVLSFNSAENILYTAGIKGEKSPPEAQKRVGGIKLVIETFLSPSFLACVIFFLAVTLAVKK
ncbi:MAG: CPBP family intramembrane metalloprotease [Clostridia bacterium]|nr:CPBP family intramembrane metalloprotease [Clostridia bacterium]